jgi:hypothetical protein
MMRVRLLLLATAVVGSACVSKPFILPTPDGVGKPSPPSLQGIITRIDTEQITVRPDNRSPGDVVEIPVRLRSATTIFTVFGGYVQRSDLVAGLRVRVWFDQSKKPRRKDVATAAVIVIPSTNPGDDWP